MSKRKPFLLRMDQEVHDALARWARDELRSVNGQIEFLLRRALQQAGRLAREDDPPGNPPPEGAVPD